MAVAKAATEVKGSTNLSSQKNMRGNRDVEEIKQKVTDSTRIKSFYCQKCGIFFDDITKLHYHIFQTSDKDHTFRCASCEYIVGKTVTSVIFHTKRFCSRKALKQCEEKLMLERPDQKRYYCERCGKGVGLLADLVKHYEEHKNQSLCCCLCNKMAPNFSDMLIHFRLHTVIGNIHLTCKLCPLVFYASGPYKLHYYTVHSQMFNIPFKCDLCVNVIFDDEEKFLLHVQGHCQINNDIKPGRPKIDVKHLTCEVCAEIFDKYDDCRKHKNEVHQLNANAMRLCCQCNNNVPISEIPSHLLLHQKEKATTLLKNGQTKVTSPVVDIDKNVFGQTSKVIQKKPAKIPIFSNPINSSQVSGKKKHLQSKTRSTRSVVKPPKQRTSSQYHGLRTEDSAQKRSFYSQPLLFNQQATRDKNAFGQSSLIQNEPARMPIFTNPSFGNQYSAEKYSQSETYSKRGLINPWCQDEPYVKSSHDNMAKGGMSSQHLNFKTDITSEKRLFYIQPHGSKAEETTQVNLYSRPHDSNVDCEFRRQSPTFFKQQVKIDKNAFGQSSLIQDNFLSHTYNSYVDPTFREQTPPLLKHQHWEHYSGSSPDVFQNIRNPTEIEENYFDIDDEYGGKTVTDLTSNKYERRSPMPPRRRSGSKDFQRRSALRRSRSPHSFNFSPPRSQRRYSPSPSRRERRRSRSPLGGGRAQTPSYLREDFRG